MCLTISTPLPPKKETETIGVEKDSKRTCKTILHTPNTKRTTWQLIQIKSPSHSSLQQTIRLLVFSCWLCGGTLSVSNVYGNYILTRSIELKKTDCSFHYSDRQAKNTDHREHSERQRTKRNCNTNYTVLHYCNSSASHRVIFMCI